MSQEMSTNYFVKEIK